MFPKNSPLNVLNLFFSKMNTVSPAKFCKANSFGAVNGSAVLSKVSDFFTGVKHGTSGIYSLSNGMGPIPVIAHRV